MEKENGICSHEKTVKPVKMDTGINGVSVSANGDGVNGDHAVNGINGTNGVKASSTRIDLADTSLPPAAIKVSFDWSGPFIPRVTPNTDQISHRSACDGPI